MRSTPEWPLRGRQPYHRHLLWRCRPSQLAGQPVADPDAQPAAGSEFRNRRERRLPAKSLPFSTLPGARRPGPLRGAGDARIRAPATPARRSSSTTCPGTRRSMATTASITTPGASSPTRRRWLYATGFDLLDLQRQRALLPPDCSGFYGDLFPFEDSQNFMSRDRELAQFHDIRLRCRRQLGSSIPAWPHWIEKGTLNLNYNRLLISYDDFHDFGRVGARRTAFRSTPTAPASRSSLFPCGTEPLFASLLVHRYGGDS